MTLVIISDTSSLVLLEKIKLLECLIKKTQFIIPQEVYNEAVTNGIKKKALDAYKIERKVKEGVIKIKKVKEVNKIQDIIENFGVGIGEAAAIQLFTEHQADVLATDDHKSMNVCRIYEIPFMTSLTFILNSVNNKVIKEQDAEEMIRQLSVYGRYKDELINEALKRLKGEKNG